MMEITIKKGKNIILSTKSIIQINPSNQFQFTVQSNAKERIYEMQTDTKEEAEEWVQAMRTSIEYEEEDAKTPPKFQRKQSSIGSPQGVSLERSKKNQTSMF